MKRLYCFALLISTAAAGQTQTIGRCNQQIRSITLARGGCLGGCPAYTVTVDERGAVDYTFGPFGNDEPKVEHYTVRSVAARKLFEKLLPMRNALSKDKYSNGVVDDQTTDITFRTLCETKTISEDGKSAPKEFHTIAARIDKLTGAMKRFRKQMKAIAK